MKRLRDRQVQENADRHRQTQTYTVRQPQSETDRHGHAQVDTGRYLQTQTETDRDVCMQYRQLPTDTNRNRHTPVEGGVLRTISAG